MATRTEQSRAIIAESYRLSHEAPAPVVSEARFAAMVARGRASLEREVAAVKATPHATTPRGLAVIEAARRAWRLAPVGS